MTTQDKIIPVGYKLTEVGVIPTDWDVSRRENIIQNVIDNRGKTPPLATRGFPLIEVNAIYKQGKHPNLSLVSKFVNKSTYENWFRKGHPNKGTILIVTVGSAGESSIIQNPIGCIAQNIIGLNIKDSYDNNFVFYYTKTNKFKKDVKAVLMGAVQPSLKVPHIFNFQIPLPPTLEEQTRIATVLSDIDELITQMDELIAKKKAIKQGAMQSLLTPKKNWEVKKFPSVCWFQEGPGVRNYQFTKSGVKLLNGTNIENGKLLLDKTDRFISEKEAYGIYSHFLVDSGDILIACSGVTIDKFEEKVTIAGDVHLPLCMNTSTMRFKVSSDKLIKNYLFHFLKSDKFKEQIGGKATGSAQLNFGPSHVSNTDIYLPNPKEQTRIANSLSDMDQEIQQLEQKKAKYEQIKQGAMQQLLTGKIRLK